MEFKKSKNSVVILASQHNPTVFLGNFLHASGIIKNDNEVKKESSIITPAFAQVLFINGDTIQVDPDRLKIEGNFGEAPFLKGICYMSALPHIACRAIGINFTYEISDFDLNNFVNWELKNKYKASGVNVIFENDNGMVKSLITKDDFYAEQSKQFVEQTFGSLPKFLAAFSRNKKMSDKEIDELQRLINEHKEV